MVLRTAGSHLANWVVLTWPTEWFKSWTQQLEKHAATCACMPKITKGKTDKKGLWHAHPPQGVPFSLRPPQQVYISCSEFKMCVCTCVYCAYSHLYAICTGSAWSFINKLIKVCFIKSLYNQYSWTITKKKKTSEFHHLVSFKSVVVSSAQRLRILQCLGCTTLWGKCLNQNYFH